jgi:hypothetical protein
VNPVGQVRGIRITAEGGESLLLPVYAVPQELAKALPNSVSASVVWVRKKCGFATFLQPTKYPAVRKARFEIQLELTDLPGRRSMRRRFGARRACRCQGRRLMRS